ncbi:MAG: DUF2892 domain-containing protein [Acidimicrobiales bacterium]
MLKKNMGSIDRAGRGVLAVVLLIVAAVAGFGSVGGIIALVLAVVMAATAAVGSCPLYLPLHINTAKRASSR